MSQGTVHGRFVEVTVEPHADLPDGFSGRWMTASAAEEVATAWYAPDDGEDGDYPVVALWRDGRATAARAVWVEDSAAGLSRLVWGGDHGLRIGHPTGQRWAEPYLLLAGRDG